MSKKLYAMTNVQAKWIGYYAKVNGVPSLDDALTPLDRAAVVERMADAMIAASPDRAYITEDEREWYMRDARAALDALQEDE